MDEVPHVSLLAAWIRAIGVLAASTDQQARWLDSLGPVAPNVDELALEFDDGFRLLPQWVAAGWVSERSVAPMRAVNSALADMSGKDNAALWTRDALAEHRAWEVIHSLAMDALCSVR